MRRFLLLCGLVAGGLLARSAAAQTLDASFAAPTSLYSTASVDVLGPPQADGKRLVGSYVSRVNNVPLQTGLIRLDASGALDQAFALNVGSASTPYRIRGLANGQYLLGAQGSYLTAGGLTRIELLRLNANGTADASFDAGTGPQRGAGGFGYSEDFVALPDGKVVVGGRFDTFNGMPANGLVRLNANGSVDNGFSAGLGIAATTSDDVLALAVQPDGKVLAGGHFSTFNGQAANALVRLNANGTRDATFTSALGSSDYIYGLLLQPDGNLLVTGVLYVNGARTSLVRLLPSGAIDPTFSLSPALGTQVYTLYLELPMALQPDGKIVVCGGFDLPGYRRVARLNADGSLDLAFQAPVGPTDAPATLGLQPSGSILLGGNFTSVGNAETSLAQFASTGTVDAAYAPKLQNTGSVDALARQADGSVLAGGNFTEWDGVPAHRLVRLSATGVLDAAYTAAVPPLASDVTALLVQADGKTVVGTYSSVERLLTTGAPDPGFAQYPAGAFYVSALAQQADGKLLVAGSIGAGVGTANNRLVRLTTSGANDATFGSISSSVGPISTPSALLVQSDGRIVLAANSSASGLTNVSYVQRFEATGATDASWTVPSFTYATSSGVASQARVSALVQQPDGKLLAGGRFTRIGSATQHHLARFGSTGALDASFAPGTTTLPNGGNVLTLALQPNGRLLVGGSFFVFAGAAGTYNNLLRVLDAGQLDASFAPSANPQGAVRTLLVQPDGGILLQGFFNAVAGQPRLNLARLTAPNVLAVAAPAAVAVATEAWPVPAHEVLRVLPAAMAHPQAAELLDALGRVVRQRALAGPGEFGFDVQGLPAGLYVLRLRYQEGTVSQQVVVE